MAAKDDGGASQQSAVGAVFGNYLVVSELGAGAGGVVYRAKDRETGAAVALKMLHSVTAEHIARLKSEFRAAEGLHDPNLVQLGELFEHEGQWVLSMELVDGEDFISYVCRGGQGFVEERLRSALAQLASAISALHAARTIHRDIKPSNVLVNQDGRVVVLDFGLAMNQDRLLARDEGTTGTALFMAPEQVTGERIGPAADWYAVGVMLFRALTGRHPFEGTQYDVMSAKVVAEAPAAEQLKEGLPEDLLALAAALLRQDPALRPTGDEVLQVLGVRGRAEREALGARATPLLGRETEMAWLDDAFRATGKQEAVTAVLHGESGVGKSILLRAFADSLSASHPHLLTLFSRCYEREDVPFKAFDGAIDTLVEALESMPVSDLRPLLSSHAGLLPRIFPELALVPSLAAEAAAVTVDDPLQARRLGFEAFRHLLRGIAAARPILLIIDDLQWADADSLLLLRALLEPPGTPPLLLVCTLRLGEGSPSHAMEEAERLPGDVRFLPLRKLTAEAATKFVRDLVAYERLAEPTPEEIDALVRESGGHPMFLAELLLQRKSDGEIRSHLKLDDALRQRVKRLSPAVRRLLEVVCVAGIPIPKRVAAAAAELPADELLKVVPQLSAQRLVQTWGFGRTITVEPYHDRVRESVVAGLSDVDLSARQSSLARAFEVSGSTVDAEVLAELWQKSGDLGKAKDYLLRAAEKSNATLAFEHAASLLQRAIDLTSDESEKNLLFGQLAEALTNANRCRDAAAVRLSLATKLCGVDALRLRTFAAEQLLCAGRFDEGTGVLEDVLRSQRVYVPSSPVMIVLSAIVARLVLLLRGFAVRRRSVESSPEQSVQIDALIAAGFGFAMTDSMLGAYFNTRALLRALDSGSPLNLSRTLSTEACYTSSTGLPARRRVLQLMEQLRVVSADIDRFMAEGLRTGPVGYLHYFVFEWPEAKAALLRTAQIFDENCVGQFWAVSTARTLGFRAMVQLGEKRELARLTTIALRDMEQAGDLYGISNVKSGPVAWLRLADDELALAESELADVKKLLPARRFVVQTNFYMTARAHLDLYSGRAEAAYKRVERAWPRLQRSLLLRVSVIRAVAWDLRGRVALALALEADGNRRERLLRASDRAASRLEREGYPCPDGFAALLRAGGALVRGDRKLAEHHAERAAVAFEKASMKLHVAASRWYQGLAQGGDAGGGKIAGAREVFDLETVRLPERFVRLIAPAVEVRREPL